MDINNSIVIDNGTGYIKAGFGGYEKPQNIILNCVGNPKSKDFIFKGRNCDFIGEEMKAIKNQLKFDYPVKRGIIQDWNNMEKIWDHTFKELTGNPAECNINIIEPIMNPKEQKEKIAQIMFEKFKVPGLYLTNSGLLSLYGNGLFDGISVDSGEGITQFLPVLNGVELQSQNIINFGGQDLTEYMFRLLNEIKNIPIEGMKETIKMAKEKVCYVPLNFNDELKKVEPFEYLLPDNSKIFIKDQRIKCCEAIFNPISSGLVYDGNLAQHCNDCIKRCKENEKKTLYSKIVLSGGNTMFQGLPERFSKEIRDLAPQNFKECVNVLAKPNRNMNAWIGGSIVSSLSSYKSFLITKDNYKEMGPSIVHKKI